MAGTSNRIPTGTRCAAGGCAALEREGVAVLISMSSKVWTFEVLGPAAESPAAVMHFCMGSVSVSAAFFW